ncbi:MAG TPA: SufD family Fe-S cluster assembly protein [Dehalococcoidia bacterium]|jgi:Fe-S cluster assembly scaffold protein SufB|nr:SufD family Fe-S cluster assembly protein [Dehalococcoidia bacterium]
MISYSIEKEYQGLVDAYEKAGGDRSTLLSKEVAKLVIHENKVLGVDGVNGIQIETKETETGVNIYFLVEEGAKILRPVHLCFGILPQEGLQEIILKVDAQDNSEVSVIAHCIFPNAVKVIHKMDADIEIGNNAKFDYKETHYHGDFGGIEVIPKAKITLGEMAQYENTFRLIQGSVGTLDFDFEVFSGARSVAELIAKVYSKKDDVIKIVEKVHLNGNGARSLIKTRIVLRDRARAEVIGETYGNAPYTRGHVDCIELVNGEQAVAKAIPIVSVTDEKAKVTHEAAIGSIDKRQVETLMTRGLDENQAVDVIVKGILR